MEFEIIIRQAGVDYSSQYISITSVDKKVQKSLTIDEASTSVNGLMSAPDKRKLDGIASGANNYSLPVASADTLGGIKVGYSGTLTGYDFPVKLDDEGNAVANIDGLFAIGGVLKNINFTDGNTSTNYDVNSIRHDTPSGSIMFNFPSKSGTFALESDCLSSKNGSVYPITTNGVYINFTSAQ
nr:MAG TPA: Head fiber protein [Caudoviricetes sp.]